MAKDKLTIQEMAERLGVKKENLEVGLNADRKATESAIEKAYDFKFNKR